MSTAVGTPGTVRSTSVLALVCNVPVGIVAYAFGFVTSYMLNDSVSTTDHLTFIGFGLIALAISATFMTGILHKAGDMPLRRAAGTSLIAGAILHAAFIAIVLGLVS